MIQPTSTKCSLPLNRTPPHRRFLSIPVSFIFHRFLPRQSSLTIYNSSRLYINLEGCVNTLRGECVNFIQTHGRDGDNNTAQSRFLCFYNKVRDRVPCMRVALPSVSLVARRHRRCNGARVHRTNFKFMEEWSANDRHNQITIRTCSSFLPFFLSPSIHLQNDPLMVLARFDLAKTWREFLISFSVPATLFVISFISLCIITRSVKVGDDAKMRCKYCTEGEENSDVDENLANNGRMDPAAVEQALIDADARASTSKVCSHTQRHPRPYNSNYSKLTFLFYFICFSRKQPFEPTATTSHEAHSELHVNRDVPPINLSPCTEATEKSSISATTDEKPLVVL